MKTYLGYISVFILFSLLAGCDSPEVIHDFSSRSFELVDEDSVTVYFPSDFEGDYVVAGFIYTHCPDICSITTANMKNAFNQLEDTSDVQFVAITFDPKRDTPAVLKNYKQNFELDEQKFTMLTGDTASIDSVLNAMNITAKISHRDSTDNPEMNYYFNHTDRIYILDKRSRARFEYPGSKVPPEHIVEDINKLR